MDEIARRAEQLFQEAVDLQCEARSTWLERQCGGDTALRAEVEELLAALEKGGAFLERDPALASIAPMPAAISHYRLVRLIGEGGMGCVYEAVQDAPHRSVALKVLRPGSISGGLLHRFRRESELLAQLRHPGIAQVYEVGTFQPPEGGADRPYFAMELVEGLPLEAYATHHSLELRERLELFARLCDAVQHAHVKGVIHRDLKPANILVDADGQPKVLDFGIARAFGPQVEPTTLRTEPGELLGTLAYMSPEQIGARPGEVDQRTDVYALGVLLYQLLAGCLPHDLQGKSLPEAGRVIQEDEPTRLGTRNGLYRGDLETIVAKALEKEKERRYASAAELAGDVRRHLRDEPISARPASAAYRLRKFARRNKGLVGGVVATIVVLSTALVAVSLQAVRIRREKLRAEEINEFMESILAGADPYPLAEGANLLAHFGMNAKLVDVLGELLQRLDQRPLRDPVAEATIRQRMSLSFFGIARFEEGARNGERALAMLADRGGDVEPLRLRCKMALACNLAYLLDCGRAERLAREAVAGCERIYGEHHEETLRAYLCLFLSCMYAGYVDDCAATAERMWEISTTSPRPLDYARFSIKLLRAAMLVWHLDRPTEGEALAREALDECLASRNNKSHWVGYARSIIGSAVAERGDLAGAEAWHRSAAEAWVAAAGEASALELQLMIGLTISHQAGRLDEGLEAMRATVERARELHGRDAPIAARQVERLASRLRQVGRLEQAETWYREYFTMVERGRHPTIQNHAHARHDFARLLLAQDRTTDAEAEFRAGLAVAETFPRSEWRRHNFDDRRLLSGLVGLLDDQGRQKESAPLRALLQARPGNSPSPWQGDALAWELYELGLPREAEPIAREAVLDLRRFTEPVPADRFVSALDTWGACLCAIGRHEEAGRAWREAEALWRSAPSEVSDYEEISVRYGRCLTELGRFDEAELVLVRALSSLSAIDAEPELLESAREAASALYSAWGRPERAREVLEDRPAHAEAEASAASLSTAGG